MPNICEAVEQLEFLYIASVSTFNHAGKPGLSIKSEHTQNYDPVILLLITYSTGLVCVCVCVYFNQKRCIGMFITEYS